MGLFIDSNWEQLAWKCKFETKITSKQDDEIEIIIELVKHFLETILSTQKHVFEFGNFNVYFEPSESCWKQDMFRTERYWFQINNHVSNFKRLFLI